MFPKYLLQVLSLVTLSIFFVQPSPAADDKQVDGDYQPGSMALQGLNGLYINIDDVLKGAKPKNIKLQEDLKKAIIKRLDAAGMRLLSKEAMEQTPGQPEMSMFPSYPKHLGPFKPGEPRIEYNPDCCTAGIWTSFTQGASTSRTPLLNHKLATWGEGHNTSDCSDVGKWLSEAVLKTVDNFIAAKQKADNDYQAWQEKGNTEAKPAPQANAVTQAKPTEAAAAQPATEKPQEIRASNDMQTLACDTAILLYAEIFPTASATISQAKRGILRKVADNMKACPQYRYRIETHSDQRASEEYNDVLSARRAVAIRHFMVDHGVDEDQFELRFYGERKPLVAGNSAEALAANRRVTVTPIRTIGQLP